MPENETNGHAAPSAPVDVTSKTLVTFLIDRSGSMGMIQDATIEGFNAYLETLKRAPVEIDFTLVQFDSVAIDVLCRAVPIAQVEPRSRLNYQPRSGTPLIEAAIKTIRATEEALTKRVDQPKVIVAIQTDGEENQSGLEFTRDLLVSMVADKTAAGWEFVFLGSGINAYAQSAAMGIAAANTMASGMTRDEVRASYAGTATSNLRFATGAAQTAAYNMAERTASGDRFVPKDLDLNAGAAPVAPDLSKRITAQQIPPAPRKRHDTIGDVTL